MPSVRNTDPGTGTGPSDRQRHPDRRSAGSCDGGKFSRWLMPCEKPSWRNASSMPMRRWCRCWPQDRRKLTGLMSGLTAPHRFQRSRPAKALHDWLLAQRDLVPNGSATAKVLDYSLKRWVALTRYLEDGAVPIDNNAVENQIRPWALGRSNWLFAGSLRSGKRAAAIMSSIQSARMNGHDPYAYLNDVLTRLPTQRASEIDQLLPHQWVSA